MLIESPQSFGVSTECKKAAEQNGFRRQLHESGGWIAFQSTTAQGTIWLAAATSDGPWFLALDHRGVIGEAGLDEEPVPGPGQARFQFKNLGELYSALERIYRLSVSLPDAPLCLFHAETRDLPNKTEAERLIVQRIGQNIFRRSLLGYWNYKCPLTGISDAALLRASHIIPWKDCPDDFERLNVHNGLLLSALWDAAFDKGYLTFTDDGTPVFSNALSEQARSNLQWSNPIPMTDEHAGRLKWHREKIFVT